MKRRSFIQRSSLGLGSLFIRDPALQKSFTNTGSLNFEVSHYNDLLTREDEVMIRFNYSSNDRQSIQVHSGRFNVTNGEAVRMKTYFFHHDTDKIDYRQRKIHIESYPWSQHVIVLWIRNGSDNTTIEFPFGNAQKSVSISEIVDAKDFILNEDAAWVSVSYLLDREIGEIDPADYGIKAQGDRFTIAAMADPQGGNPFSHQTVTTRMRIHNAFIDESVRVINELEETPAFTMVIGDIVDGQGHQDDFRAMNDMLSKIKSPVLYELGNHETRYDATFSSGYNMSAFTHFFAAQKEFNGMEKLAYSFNLGNWHFIVWPDPLRAGFWETHPHYFYWLEKDLEKHKNRPTIFFQHIPIHPVGILPLINYAESVHVKRMLLDILSGQGNVKYVLSGHVHIPMKASVKTSITYRGMKLINLPAAGYRPRAFGEEDFNGGPSQGIAIITINGTEAGIRYKSVTNEQFTYPEPEPFNEKEFPLWLSHKWELGEEEFLNGDFSKGLRHWVRRYVYTEDVHPSNLCEVKKREDDRPYLYLFNRSRGYNTPGQDRLPQSINRVCQVVNLREKGVPLISMEYWIDPLHYIPENRAGSYIWIEGFEKGLKRLNVVYSNDFVHWNLGGNQSQLRVAPPVHLDITSEPGKWHELRLNPYNDFMKYREDERTILDNIDKLAINLGVWTLNEGYRKHAGAGFAEIQLEYIDITEQSTVKSSLDSVFIERKEEKHLWWHGIDHVAGEHQSEKEDLNKYLDER